MEQDAPPLRELSEARCWQLLADQSVGRLAVSVAGVPDVFPVNYVVHDGRIVIRTVPGTKLAASIGRQVAFEVDALDEPSRTGWSVVVHGDASEPRLVEDYLEAMDLEPGPWLAGPRDRVIVIDAERISGRVIPPARTGVAFRSACLDPSATLAGT